MTSAFSSPIRSYCSARWAAARRTSAARSGWLEMLGIRRKSSSSRRPCSRVSWRNPSGVAIRGYLRQREKTKPRWLVDEPQEVKPRRGLDGAVIEPAPSAVVHLRDGEGTVPVHRLDVGHVSDRRRPADALHHDGAHHWHLSLGEAELLRVVPPLPGIAGPRDITLVRHPPGAIPVRELVAAGAVAWCVAVSDGVVRYLRTEAVPRHRAHRLLADPRIVQRRPDPVGKHQHGAGLQVVRITDQVEIDDVLDLDVVLDGQGAQLSVGLDLDQDAVDRRHHESLALDDR